MKQLPKTIYVRRERAEDGEEFLYPESEKEAHAIVGGVVTVGKYELVNVVKLITLVSEETATQGD